MDYNISWGWWEHVFQCDWWGDKSLLLYLIPLVDICMVETPYLIAIWKPFEFLMNIQPAFSCNSAKLSIKRLDKLEFACYAGVNLEQVSIHSTQRFKQKVEKKVYKSRKRRALYMLMSFFLLTPFQFLAIFYCVDHIVCPLCL